MRIGRTLWMVIPVLMFGGAAPAQNTVLVSVSSAGVPANERSDDASISGDGRFVAFRSIASNLVPGDTNNDYDVFVHDRDADGDGIMDEPGAIATTRASVSPSGEEGDRASSVPAISADGRYVVFETLASNLVPGIVNTLRAVVVHDRLTGAMSMIRPGPYNREPAISVNGRFVAFTGTVTEHPCPGSGIDVFVADRDPDGDGVMDGGTITLVSRNWGGGIANGCSHYPSISGDGRHIAFYSVATDLVLPETEPLRQNLFVRDMVMQTTRLVSIGMSGEPANGSSGPTSALSHDGRFIVFSSAASNLAPGDSDGLGDLYIRDLVLNQTQMLMLQPPLRVGHVSPLFAITPDARFVAVTGGCESPHHSSSVQVLDRQGGGGGTLRNFGVEATGELDQWGRSNPSVSADGQAVAFESSNTSGVDAAIFVHDRRAPMPGPAWTNAAGGGEGGFGDGANWQGTIVPGPGERALFNLDADYTVSLGADVSNGLMLVRDGEVTLDLGGHVYALTNAGTSVDSLRVAQACPREAGLSMMNGIMTTAGNAGIGGELAMVGHLTVGPGCSWLSDGDVNVSYTCGGECSGSLTIAGGGTLRSDRLHIGRGGALAIEAGGMGTATTIFQVFSGGELRGDGVLEGRGLVSGIVRPGRGVGRLLLAGNLTMGSAALLAVEIGGPGAGAGHDLLEVTGAATISGALQVELEVGFDPPAHSSYEVLRAGARSGQFASASFPVFADQRLMRLVYEPGRVVVAVGTVIPADWNGSGAVDSQDFFDFLGAFFATPPDADFNASGATDSQDFFDFVACFFGAC